MKLILKRITKSLKSKRAAHICVRIILSFLLGVSLSLNARPLPAPLTAALILKISALEKQTREKKTLTIQVINDEELANYLIEHEGESFGNQTIGNVINGDTLGKQQPDIIFVGRGKSLDAITRYAIAHKIPTFSDDVALVNKNIVMAVYDNEGVPGIVLNQRLSQQHQLLWDPKILNFVKLVE